MNENILKAAATIASLENIGVSLGVRTGAYGGGGRLVLIDEKCDEFDYYEVEPIANEMRKVGILKHVPAYEGEG